MSQPMQVLVSRNTNEWYTPPAIIERVRTVLGSITLDPASDPVPQSWIQATHYFTQDDDGLSKTWFGRVFLNPPYNGSSAKWAAKLIEEYRSGRVEQAIMLVNSAHGCKWYEALWTSFPVCCLRDRLRFIKPNGEAGGQAKKGPRGERFASGFEDVGRILFPDRVKCKIAPVRAAHRTRGRKRQRGYLSERP
jgi:hypothetical protein